MRVHNLTLWRHDSVIAGRRPRRPRPLGDEGPDAAPPPPGSPRCVVCSTTQDVFIVERAQDLLRAEFYAWCCSSCARKYVKPRPDPKELCFATYDDEPLSPMKRTRLSF